MGAREEGPDEVREEPVGAEDDGREVPVAVLVVGGGGRVMGENATRQVAYSSMSWSTMSGGCSSSLLW
eukprot:7420754-Lingulodinium_polyedra.AAC.1